jgi:hypothetical protein
MGRISIAFATGSVVVPGTDETIAAGWFVNALIKLDFPAFRRPKMPICRREPAGVCCKFNDIEGSILPKVPAIDNERFETAGCPVNHRVSYPDFY